MELKKITITILLISVTQQFSIAQTGQWKLAGNDLNGTQKIGKHQ